MISFASLPLLYQRCFYRQKRSNCLIGPNRIFSLPISTGESLKSIFRDTAVQHANGPVSCWRPPAVLLLLLLLQMSRFKWRRHYRCGGTLQNLPIKCYTTLVSVTVCCQSAGNGARFLSAKWLTDKMGFSLSSECQYWWGGPGLWWQTVPRPRGSHGKRAVTEGWPTSWRHQQRRWVNRAYRRGRAMISARRRLPVNTGATPSLPAIMTA